MNFYRHRILGFRCIVVIFCILLTFWDCSESEADILILKGQSTPICGKLMSDENGKVEFRLRRPDGSTEKKTFQKDKIEFVVQSLPKEWKKLSLKGKIETAERLVAMKNDWEARYLAQEMFQEILAAKAIDRETRLVVRWQAFRGALSAKQARQHMVDGILVDGKPFIRLLQRQVVLPFPDQISPQQAKLWAQAIFLLRVRKQAEGRLLLKKVTGSGWTKDCNQFAVDLDRKSDRLEDPKIQLYLLENELLFEAAASKK